MSCILSFVSSIPFHSIQIQAYFAINVKLTLINDALRLLLLLFHRKRCR